MKNSAMISFFVSALVFFSLCALFSGKPDDAGFLASLNPVEAVSGLSFALGFAAGLPPTAAVIAAVVLLVLVPTGVFLIARRFLRRYDG
ncbi:hypothetical protein [Lysobacter sp. A03]|uniref:hypothetical protein n=1 Tax=Lysobacter sp. A03 TaxID=1199154 RepID=UPI0005B7074B|nr:hypothetical protein [Lysobacter sp. A03]KIQ97228.1 hypothetical protein TI01_1213 [Lysobacter sp. A03]